MWIEVDYRLPGDVDAERQAWRLAVGQTAGTWDTRFAHREASLRAHLGEVRGVYPLEDGTWLAIIRYPQDNTEGDIPSLLTMIFGKYSMAGPCKVQAIRLPDGYGLKPRYGLSGIRARLGVFDRPLLMAVFKPALGLSAEDYAEMLLALGGARIDIVKDDEVQGDLEAAPTLSRVRACRKAITTIERETGRRVLYAVNVTARGENLVDRARMLVEEGANALLINVLAYGFSALEALATAPGINVPIFAHPALAGALCAAPEHGFSYSSVLGTLMSHAGADAVLYPGHYGSRTMTPDEEFLIRDALVGRNVFPVPSAGVHPGIVPRALADYGPEVILNAGAGIMDHPDGPANGVRAFHEALDAASHGTPFDVDTLPEGPLRRAIEKWGSLV